MKALPSIIPMLIGILASIRNTSSIVVINPVSPVSIGGSTAITCNLTGEVQTSFSWFFVFNGTSTQCNLATIITPSCPSRYAITQTTFNSTHLLFSTLTINSVTSDDLRTTFECRASTTQNANLSQITTTTQATTTTAFEACFAGSYNDVAYVLIMISNVVIILSLVFCYFFIKDPMTFQLLILYLVILLSAMLIIIMIIFWINPKYVSGDSTVWPAIVILPCGIASLLMLWAAFLYFFILAFKYEKVIEIPVFVIACVICFCHLFMSALILSSISYCTRQTAFSVIAINYSVLTDIASAFILFTSLILASMIFWKHKGKKSIIGIESAPLEHIHDHTVYSGFHGVKSTNPSVNLSPTNMHANMRDLKSSLNAIKAINENNDNKDKEKKPIQKEDTKESKKDNKQKEKEKEKEKEKDKSKKQDKIIKVPEINNIVKSPETSFSSMDFDQNDLRRSTPNPEEVESAPKTTNPLLMNFIKNSNEQANLEAIEEENTENKRKTPKLKKEKEKKDSKESKDKKEKKEKKENKDETQKESGRSAKKEEKKSESKKKKEKTPAAPVAGQDSDGDFDLDPLSEATQKDDALDTQRTESEVKKVKKEGKGKTKPPKE